MAPALMHTTAAAQHVTGCEVSTHDGRALPSQTHRQCSALGSLVQRSMQLQRHYTAPAWRVSGRSRSRAVVASAQQSSVAERPQQHSVPKDSAKSEAAKQARQQMQSLKDSNPYVEMIWDLQVHEGSKSDQSSKVMWLNTPRSVLGKLALGGRVNAFVASSHSCAPNLDIELYHYPVFGKLFMYLNLVPRRSLIQFPKDVERFYMTPHAAAGDLTYQQLFEECEARKDWERYRVTDPYVRALTGGTSIMYQMEATEGNAADVKRLSERVYQIWAALVDSPDVPKPEAGETETNCEQAALAATDAKLLDYAKHDPDVQKAVPLIGQQGVDDMLALLSRDSSIFN